ncbi:MAG: PKD domain-containing protein, partial [Flavobacteriia bacterium]
DFSSGMPNCAVADLEIYYGTNTLRAATYGRSTWESDLYSSVAAGPVASFTADNVNICVGQSVQFTSTSTGNPTSYSWAFSGGTPATSTDQNPSVVYNTAGTYNVSLTATNATGSNTSTQTAFITVTGSSTNTLPVSEGFTGSTFPPTAPATWSVVNTDAGATTWTNSTTVGVAPTAGNSMFFDNYNFDDSGNSDEVRLPKLNFTGYSAAQMTFHVAYAPFTQNGTIFADGLQVLASSDCGTTWDIVYDKSGNTVATGNLPTVAAVTTQFTPTAAQWRQETIDLTSYVGQSNVIIAFKNMAAYGNRLFIDNINLTGTSAPTAPTASFTASPTGSSCIGQSVQFTSTSTNNPTSYSWSFPSGTPATSTSATPAVTWSTAGTYTVSLTATNANGSNTTTQSFVVNANPTVTQGALSAVCATTSPFALTGGSPAGGTYSGTGVTSGSFNPSVAGPGSTTITYTYSQNGCAGTATTPITVNAAPSIVSTTPASACGSASLTLGASASAGTVSWYAAASGGTALATGTSYTTGVLSATTTFYAETSSGGCNSTRVAVQATINPNPTVNAPSQQNFCTGQTSTLISFTGSSSSSTYAWTNNNTTIGLAASGTGNIAAFTPNVAGISTITVTPTLNGCVGSPQSFQITVNQSPTVTQSPLNQICVYGSPFTLSSGSPAGGTYSGAGVSAGSFNPATAGVGTFPITYSYAQNGCTGTAVANITVSACASIEEQTEQTLLLYPNPTSTILTVEGSDLVRYTTLELYDATGRVVQEWKVNKDKMSLDLSKYAVGSYSLHFIGVDNERIERVEIIK